MNEERLKQIINESFVGKVIEDEGITDIRFNGTALWLQHNQKGKFRSDIQPTKEEVKTLAKQIADAKRKSLTNTDPILDTDIDNLRVNVMHDVISPDGMTMAIRVSRPKLAVSNISNLLTNHSEEVEELLRVLVLAGSNIIISGETGAGKTELQKMMVGYISENEIITLIEDTRDSHIKALYPKKDINSWQTVNAENEEDSVTISDLNKAALRNNPDWILVSETRGEEAADMLDSTKTGHSIITTIHAKGAMYIPSRLISMIRSAPAYAVMDDQLVGMDIVDFLRFGIHLDLEVRDGKVIRKIKEVVEFTDFDPKGATGQALYKESKHYDESTGKYKLEGKLGKLSDKTLELLKDKQLYHLLPSVFKEESEVINL